MRPCRPLGRWLSTPSRLCHWQRCTTACASKTRRIAARRPLEPSITQSRPASERSPRSTNSRKNAVNARSFSVPV